MTQAALDVPTPRWAAPLQRHARYKGAHGGRGSGKSHEFATAVVLNHVADPNYSTVCVREVQKSLAQSVKRLIEDKIEELGVGHLFEVQKTEILSRQGRGRIIFVGMQDHTADSVKSLEGFDCAWVEEAQSLSQKSLDLLRPTIRKPGSELWFTWNPHSPDDPIERLLRGQTPPDGAIVVEVNFTDNPWFPDVLREEMEYDRRRDYEKYTHVWLGAYATMAHRLVFKNWRVEEFEAPSDAHHRFGADWGFSVDPTVLVRCHVIGRTLFIDYEAYRIGCEIVDTPALFATVPESTKWPIFADNARPETISHLQKHGFPKVMAASKGARSVEEGIEWLRSYDLVIHPRCEYVIRELKTYSYKADEAGNVLPILADKDNHCIAEGELVLCERGQVPIEEVTTDDRVMTRGGWRPVLFAGITDYDRDIVRVMTTVGSFLCTPDHKVWTSKGFVRADALAPGNGVLGTDGLAPGHVVDVKEAGRCARVYDLTVEEHHEFVVGGVLVSNCIDALRYACEAARKTSKAIRRPVVDIPTESRW
jgi:phage terminase large subunit